MAPDQMSETESDSYAYDVCLSFAGENREYVEATAAELRKRGVRVFYDKYEQAELWGKDLQSRRVGRAPGRRDV
jgi:hypothetical protein